MKTHTLIITVLSLLISSLAVAQSPTRFLSIPSSSFTPVTAGRGYDGNISGTARFFRKSYTMFAPLDMPNGATITSMRCGGRAPRPNWKITFTLRRNEPQQANVDMAAVMTTLEEIGFQFLNTTLVTSPVIDNAKFNYYIVATKSGVGFAGCNDCSVGFCRIGYTADPS
jgi:hypothetical protein